MAFSLFLSFLQLKKPNNNPNTINAPGAIIMTEAGLYDSDTFRPKSVPAPKISRMDETMQSESVHPKPKPAPSKTEMNGLFLYAKDSARYMIIQLTTISGMNIPSDAFNSGGRYAFISNSTIVTKAAIITIKHGIRISRGINDRTREII